MSITKLTPVGPWPPAATDVNHAGATLGGRRIITGMLTGEPADGSERAFHFAPPRAAKP